MTAACARFPHESVSTRENGARARAVRCRHSRRWTGEVRVAVGAVSTHPVDLETRAGKNAMMLPNKRPFTPGVDFAGTVEAIGEGVDDLAPGDRVYGYRGLAAMGAIAEQIVVPRGELARAPAGIEPERLAAFPLPDYTSTRFEDATSEVDLVFDTVGGKTLERSFAVVRPGGTVVSLGAMPDADVLRRACLACSAGYSR